MNNLVEKCLLSWEGIRIVLHKQDKAGQSDNMFRLEAIAQAQLEHAIPIIAKEERGRIIDFLEKHKVRTGAQRGWHISFSETTWQALKGEDK